MSIPLDNHGLKILFDASDYRVDQQVGNLKTSQRQPKLNANESMKIEVKDKRKLRIADVVNKLTLFHVNDRNDDEGSQLKSIDMIVEKENLFDASGDYKLIDVNLQNMFNYYIYNENHPRLKMFEQYDLNMYSIAQMAYYYSKRRWISGIIDNRDFNEELNHYLREYEQIQFIIDITDEVVAVLKDKFASFNNDNAVQTRLKFYNLFCDNGRYYGKFYAPMRELFMISNDKYIKENINDVY